ncbi:hypothetical protein ACUVZD_000006 [Pseudomonas aeruginosa]
MDELEHLDAIAQDQQLARKKGHARIALRHKEAYLKDALSKFITLPRIAEDLAENGVAVSVASIRKWLMEFMPEHYAEYLKATGRGQKVNRAGATDPEKTDALKNAVTLNELIEAAAIQADSEIRGKRGSARAQLLGREATLVLMMEKRLTLSKQVDILEQLGINVTLTSLRYFLISELPEQWADYLSASSRGRKKNRRHEANSPDTVAMHEQPGTSEPPTQTQTGKMPRALELWLAEEETIVRQNRRGAGYALLNPMRPHITLLMSRGKSMKDIHRALVEALGVKVDIKTLRKFVAENMQDEHQASIRDL